MLEGFAGMLQEASLKHGVHHGCGRPHPGQEHQHPIGQELAASQDINSLRGFALMHCISQRWSEPVSKASSFPANFAPQISGC